MYEISKIEYKAKGLSQNCAVICDTLQSNEEDVTVSSVSNRRDKNGLWIEGRSSDVKIRRKN